MTDDDDEPAETFYSEDRWQNWLTRVGEEDLDPESEDFARLYFNLQNDTTIAIAKIITAAGTSPDTWSHLGLEK